jgi:flagellar hook-associated protein 1 FlgK
MSSLLASLSNAASALDAQSLGLAATSSNLANLNNPNYAEEVVNFAQTDTTASNPGASTETATLSQLRNSLLDKQVMLATGQQSSLTAQQTFLQEAQSALNETITGSTAAASSLTDPSESTQGISSSLTSFFTAFQAYAANPTNAGEQQSLLQQAASFANQINQTDSQLAQVQGNATAQAGADVTQANQLLGSIAKLNGQIAQSEANGPGGALSLIDTREGDLEQLAQILPINATADSTGQIQITTPDANGNPISLVDKTNVLGSLALNGTAVTAGVPPATVGLTSGSLQGELLAATGPIQTIRSSLDALSSQLVTAVNAAYNPTGTGGNFFAAGGTTAATIALDPTLTASTLAASTSGIAGDNTTALAVGNLANATFTTTGGDAINGTFSQFYTGAVVNFGEALSTATNNLADQTAATTAVTNQRNSVSSVSLDQEMTNMMTFQRAYQASSQVISVIDDMLSTLVTNTATATP